MLATSAMAVMGFTKSGIMLVMSVTSIDSENNWIIK